MSQRWPAYEGRADPWQVADPWQNPGQRQRSPTQKEWRVSQAPTFPQDALWKAAGRVGASFRHLRRDLYVAGVSHEFNDVLEALASSLKLFGGHLVNTTGRHAPRDALSLARPEARELVDILASLACRDTTPMLAETSTSMKPAPDFASTRSNSSADIEMHESLRDLTAKVDIGNHHIIGKLASIEERLDLASAGLVTIANERLATLDLVALSVSAEEPVLSSRGHQTEVYDMTAGDLVELEKIDSDAITSALPVAETISAVTAEVAEVQGKTIKRSYFTLPSVGPALHPPKVPATRPALQPPLPQRSCRVPDRRASMAHGDVGEQIIHGAPRALWDQVDQAICA